MRGMDAATLATLKEMGLSLLTGAVLGATFRLLGLPVPAPPVLAGVLGVFGIWLGAWLVGRLR